MFISLSILPSSEKTVPKYLNSIVYFIESFSTVIFKDCLCRPIAIVSVFSMSIFMLLFLSCIYQRLMWINIGPETV
jgi:hypothetical protein